MKSDLVSALITTAHGLARAGLGTSTSGNLSARSRGKIYLTASGVSMANTQKQNLAVMTLGGEVLNRVRPTKEAGFHLAVYRARPDVNAIIHVHPAHAIAVSLLVKSGKRFFVPSMTPQYVARAGRVPVMPYFPPGDARIAKAIKGYCSEKAFVLANHGATAFAENFEKALHIIEELEENCRVFLLAGGRGRTLSEREIGHLLRVYK
jgi:ribulose-5-phosphate 4-epimerase/fuculose-1-phosphate aldolase